MPPWATRFHPQGWPSGPMGSLRKAPNGPLGSYFQTRTMASEPRRLKSPWGCFYRTSAFERTGFVAQNGQLSGISFRKKRFLFACFALSSPISAGSLAFRHFNRRDEDLANLLGEMYPAEAPHTVPERPCRNNQTSSVFTIHFGQIRSELMGGMVPVTSSPAPPLALLEKPVPAHRRTRDSPPDRQRDSPGPH